jgi:protein archease
LLEGLGLGLYALGTDLHRVRPLEERTVRVAASDAPGLVVAFLTQLLLLEETEGFFGRTIEVRARGASPTVATARIRGETFDPERHVGREAVKAVTYHELTFDVRRGRARVIVDL